MVAILILSSLSGEKHLNYCPIFSPQLKFSIDDFAAPNIENLFLSFFLLLVTPWEELYPLVLHCHYYVIKIGIFGNCLIYIKGLSLPL